MMLVRKVGISGVLSSYMMSLFGGMMLLDSSGRRDMQQRSVGMSCHTLMMTSPLYNMSATLP